MFRQAGPLARRVRRIAALVVLTGWLVPLAVPHAADDDPVCAVGLAAEDTAGSVQQPTASSAPEHCLVCHLARSFRSTLTGGERAALWLVAGQLVAGPPDVSRRGPDVDRLPARAPPVPSTLL